MQDRKIEVIWQGKEGMEGKIYKEKWSEKETKNE